MSNDESANHSRCLRTTSRPTCPVCGMRGEDVYRGLRDSSFDAPGEWNIAKCGAEDCGTFWLNPEPVAEDLLYAYRNYHTHGDTKERSGGALKRLYIWFVQVILWATGILFERNRVDELLLKIRSPGSLLDVGCGRGDFLSRMARHGWEATGVDFDPKAAEEARRSNGLEVHVGGIECLDPKAFKFDAISSNHSIEHVHDPVRFVANCRQLLKPGGYLVIRTPNADSYGHRRYRGAWRGLEPPRHLCILTKKSVYKLADRTGFRVVECSTSHSMAEGILLASYIIEKFGHVNSVPGGVRGVLIKMCGPVLAIRERFRWSLDKACGEELCAVLCRIEASPET